jgi:predicted nucleic acid-binding protein
MLLVSRRAGWRTAERFWRGLRSGIARIEITTQADLEVASSIGERFPDQQFSLVDRTSFAVMHRLGITRVASFDKDFAVYRFGPDRRMAFVVV